MAIVRTALTMWLPLACRGRNPAAPPREHRERVGDRGAGGQDQDLELGHQRPELPEGLHAGGAGQLEVEHHGVGLELPAELDGGVAVAGLPDDVGHPIRGEAAHDALADDLVAVGDDDPDLLFPWRPRPCCDTRWSHRGRPRFIGARSRSASDGRATAPGGEVAPTPRDWGDRRRVVTRLWRSAGRGLRTEGPMAPAASDAVTRPRSGAGSFGISARAGRRTRRPAQPRRRIGRPRRNDV